MSRPAIAVVIPAWDLGECLDEAIASVLEQDGGLDVRTILVDNASDEPLAARFPPESHPTVTVVRLDLRVTAGAARNAGLAAVGDADYVLFLDGDDRLLPGALDALRTELESSPDAVAAIGRQLGWNPQTNRRTPLRWPFPYMYSLSRRPRLFARVNVLRNVLPVTDSALIRIAAARAGRFADANWAEDWAFGVDLAFQGPVVMPTGLECALYRVDPSRRTLSDEKEDAGHLRRALAGRRTIRQAVRGSASVPPGVRRLVGLAVPIHVFFALKDVLVGRQRV